MQTSRALYNATLVPRRSEERNIRQYVSNINIRVCVDARYKYLYFMTLHTRHSFHARLISRKWYSSNMNRQITLADTFQSAFIIRGILRYSEPQKDPDQTKAEIIKPFDIFPDFFHKSEG